MKRRIVSILTAVALALVYSATGWIAVAPGQAVVVRRWGRTLPKPWLQGPHWGFPLGLEKRTRIRIDEVRRLEIGVGGPAVDDEFLTGDLNLIRVRAAVQYRVSDPVAFVSKAANAEELLSLWAESSLSRALSRRGIDSILREGRAEAVRETELELARRVSGAGLGISILSVSLTEARPPDEVAADFASAQRAASDRERRINEAKSQAATTLTAAAAQADSRREQARAQADRAVLTAKARAERFDILLVEAGRDRRATLNRIRLETLREVLSKVRRKIWLSADEPVDLSIFQQRTEK